MTFDLQWTLDFSKGKAFQQIAPIRADAIISKQAYDTEADIKDNFSRTAPNPSPAGQPPAVQSGDLKKSVITRRVAMAIYDVIVQKGYGKVHEYGDRTHPPRPFFRVALYRTRMRLPKALKELIK